MRRGPVERPRRISFPHREIPISHPRRARRYGSVSTVSAMGGVK
jgi:hypothetical protein